ncbi:MAG: lipid-A-disaccharide synthase N-terminal domain-containing protein [Xanthomonadaceae bacterium]|nr:lipid-A-disaccharide synthase N-terminal domain-containing protein [Xanthomonadaceae bacterium]
MGHILQSLVNYQLTTWKVVGYLGMLMFTSRWFVQVYATRKYKRVVMPLSFWVLSVCGSLLLLAYFIFYKNDSVGILANLFPVLVSIYNLVMHLRHPRNSATGDIAA